MTSTRGRHTPDALAGLLSDKGQQAWAKQADRTTFYLPPRGGVPEIRQSADDGELVCPVEGCGAPL